MNRIKGSLSIPFAIIIAGLIIAGAIIFSGDRPTTRVANPENSQGADQEDFGFPEITLKEITKDEHIRGDFDAPIKVVEFSDIECPFCRQFHVTMKQVLEEYGDEVAWVYRHFPLSNIHPGAQKKAEASECVAELGGNDAFWAYLDILFDEQTSVDNLAKVAGRVDVKESDFTKCLESGRHQSLVQAQLQDAVTSGGQGTPHNIVVTPSGEFVPIDGAQPFEFVKQVIDAVI
jgi:protein-disulfide isomerase